MSTKESESLDFYRYLCQKIGSDKVVRIRRLISTVKDIGGTDETITSGSVGEGLILKGSDLDQMIINPVFKIYESETEVVLEAPSIPLIINTKETQPCFAQLCLPKFWNFAIVHCCKYFWQTSHLGSVLSSEVYLRNFLSKSIHVPPLAKIHGPCVSDISGNFDVAFCIKCDTWISQAQSWVSRPRTTWPAPELISKIISFGVLFVPIGGKDSTNKHLEWRFSFSVAEKLLIFSFSHTQLLCYALLKIVVKEIIEKHQDLKGLLCSYFLKTLMFWVSEENDPYVWRPNNIIACFKSCLRRLQYCVRYSMLMHYFICENNLFSLRFNTNNKIKMTSILKNLYEQGINCFASTEILQDYQNWSHKFNKSLISDNTRLFQQIMPIFSIFHPDERFKSLLYNFLHHSKTGLSKGVFALQLKRACGYAMEAAKCQHSPLNKLQYLKYKYNLSHLLIGVQSDAVSGWLMLASFFYAQTNYFASLTVIHYTLQKYTDEKILTVPFNDSMELPLLRQNFNHIQIKVLNLMKKEKLFTLLKTLNMYPVLFNPNSSLTPKVLQLDFKEMLIGYHPLSFAYFLCFLCYFRLHDITSCIHYLQQLYDFCSIKYLNDNLMGIPIKYFLDANIFRGIAHQLMGNTDIARQIFQHIAECDMYNISTAAKRLSRLN